LTHFFMGLTRARWVHRLPHPKKNPRKKITPERVGVSLTLDYLCLTFLEG
jgi:hypothetical protein